MQQLLQAVWQRERFTAIPVTHDVAEAVMLADRILVLKGSGIAFNINVDLPRPRHRRSVAAAKLEERMLHYLLSTDVDDSWSKNDGIAS